jgi:hypothetical protein
MDRKCLFAFALSAALMTLGACGGGGSTGTSSPIPSPPPSSTSMVTGVAAAGGAIAGATITLKDANNATATTTTASDGTFQVDVQSLTAPFLLGLTANGQSFYSYAPAAGSVANITQYTTVILQAYYLSLGTTVSAVFDGTLTSASFPNGLQLNLFKSVIWAPIAPYLSQAGVDVEDGIDPFTTAFTANHAGMDQILGQTNLSNDGLTLMVDNGSSSTVGTQSTTIAVSAGAASGTSSNSSGIPVSDLTTITTTQSTGAVLAKTLDTCRAHGTPIPNSSGYDCVASLVAIPGSVDIAAGAEFILEENTFIQDQLHPTLMAYDSAGNLTTVPDMSLTWTNSDASVIAITKATDTSNNAYSWPQITAEGLGSSTVVLTDPVTKVSAKLQVNVIIPVITPNPLTITQEAGGSYPSATVFLTDVTQKPVLTPSFSVTAGETSIAFPKPPASVYDGIEVLGEGPGTTSLIVTGQFGNAGLETIESTVCVQASGPPTCTPHPSTPTGLAASDITTTSIKLSWTASTDTGAETIGGYYVYRNGVLVATVKDGTSYVDTGLAPGTTYHYQIGAFDTTQPTPVASALSNTLSATTLLQTPPSSGSSSFFGSFTGTATLDVDNLSQYQSGTPPTNQMTLTYKIAIAAPLPVLNIVSVQFANTLGGAPSLGFDPSISNGGAINCPVTGPTYNTSLCMQATSNPNPNQQTGEVFIPLVSSDGMVSGSCILAFEFTANAGAVTVTSLPFSSQDLMASGTNQPSADVSCNIGSTYTNVPDYQTGYYSSAPYIINWSSN